MKTETMLFLQWNRDEVRSYTALWFLLFLIHKLTCKNRIDFKTKAIPRRRRTEYQRFLYLGKFKIKLGFACSLTCLLAYLLTYVKCIHLRVNMNKTETLIITASAGIAAAAHNEQTRIL